MKEPVPAREPAAGRGGEGPHIPSGYRSPPDRGAGNPPPWAKGSAESRDPVGAEPSLQPLCHPPPPGKGQGGGVWDHGGPGTLQISLGAPRSHTGCQGSPDCRRGERWEMRQQGHRSAEITILHGPGRAGSNNCRERAPGDHQPGSLTHATNVPLPEEQQDPSAGLPCWDACVGGNPWGWDIFWGVGVPELGCITGK